jgi:hypothetical protein
MNEISLPRQDTTITQGFVPRAAETCRSGIPSKPGKGGVALQRWEDNGHRRQTAPCLWLEVRGPIVRVKRGATCGEPYLSPAAILSGSRRSPLGPLTRA